ncbi:MAG: hypothetical protein SPI59_05705 [Finegoldia sp.]|nr:hypothetical protein [Finegoldia sp.]
MIANIKVTANLVTTKVLRDLEIESRLAPILDNKYPKVPPSKATKTEKILFTISFLS